MSDRPIVCLCGSTRFRDEWVNAYNSLARNGKIPLTITPGDSDPDPETKAALDARHKDKIALADRIFVINKGGYIGESTRSEVAYAIATDTPVQWLEPDSLIPPRNGGCWFCWTDGGKLSFDTEFDTFYHEECLDATGWDSILDAEHRDIGGVD